MLSARSGGDENAYFDVVIDVHIRGKAFGILLPARKMPAVSVVAPRRCVGR